MEPQVTLQNQAKGNSHDEAKAILDKKNTLDFSFEEITAFSAGP